jgi:hypothetical protein
MPPDSIIQTSQGIPRFNPAEICSNVTTASAPLPLLRAALAYGRAGL